jgi:hypothetical protein
VSDTLEAETLFLLPRPPLVARPVNLLVRLVTVLGSKPNQPAWRNLQTKITIGNHFSKRQLQVVPVGWLETRCQECIYLGNSHVASGTCEKARKCARSLSVRARTRDSAETSAEVGVEAGTGVRTETTVISYWRGCAERSPH